MAITLPVVLMKVHMLMLGALLTSQVILVQEIYRNLDHDFQPKSPSKLKERVLQEVPSSKLQKQRLQKVPSSEFEKHNSRPDFSNKLLEPELQDDDSKRVKGHNFRTDPSNNILEHGLQDESPNKRTTNAPVDADLINKKLTHEAADLQQKAEIRKAVVETLKKDAEIKTLLKAYLENAVEEARHKNAVIDVYSGLETINFYLFALCCVVLPLALISMSPVRRFFTRISVALSKVDYSVTIFLTHLFGKTGSILDKLIKYFTPSSDDSNDPINEMQLKISRKRSQASTDEMELFDSAQNQQLQGLLETAMKTPLVSAASTQNFS